MMKKIVLVREFAPFALLLILCVALAILNPRFLDPTNLQNNARLIGIYGVFSIGIGLVIITGGIDLSVGSLIALLGIQLAMLLSEAQWSWPLAVLSVLGVAMLLGFAHGWLITQLGLQPYIVTLCGLLIYRGLARFIANDQTKGFGTAEGFVTLQNLATGRFLGIPMPLVLLAIISLVMWFVLHRSVYGRYIFAIGRNEEAARYSGINTRLIITSTYVLSGLFGGIAAILIAFYTNSISPSSHGNYYELAGIAAAVLGGCSLKGGEGSILGILIGTALLQVLQNLVNLLGIPASLNFAVMGAIILIGAITNRFFRK
jgi:ribose transport system permease protein